MVVAKNTLPSLRELLVFLVFTSGSSALSGRPRGGLSICRYFTYLIHFFEFIQFFFSQENENFRSLPFSYVRRRLTGAQSRVSSDSYVVTPRNIRRPVQYHPNIYSTNYRAKQPSPGPNTITENKNNGTKTNLRQGQDQRLETSLFHTQTFTHFLLLA